jgi:hypothetical protein
MTGILGGYMATGIDIMAHTILLGDGVSMGKRLNDYKK